jgi:catechol 2,3-dioxygenase-like lactoylglutathione lyase family enzyme
MRIELSSVFVDNQEKALRFYTDILGFVKKTDMPVGKFRWLTVISPEQSGCVELLLEPNDNPTAKTYQAAIFDQGIPATAFAVDDRLTKRGVTFPTKPTPSPPLAIFDDTCGNLIQLYQP